MTLVAPLRDEEGRVTALVDSLASQTHAPDAVIFVDAGSVDRTPQLLKQACVDRPGWTVVEAGAATPGRARNVGVEAATTDWVALIDAGCAADPYWLERLIRVAGADPTVEMVWGHYEPAPDRWFTGCASLTYVDPPTADQVGPVRAQSVASCLLRRTLWERAGHFPDLRAGEDGMFIRRVKQLGARTAVAPEAIVWWHLQPGFASTFQRFRRYSEVNARAGEQRHWHYGVARMYLVAAVFVLAALRRPRWSLIPLIGAAYRVENSIWRRREGRGIRWAANPVRFATVAAILVTVDAGTFAGWLDALRATSKNPLKG